MTNSAVRRVAFTVVDPGGEGAGDRTRRLPRETEVDSVDLPRARSHRPVATGRSPAAGPGRSEWGIPAEALIEPSRRDRLRGWFTRNGGEAAKLDAADAGGLAWTALGLKVTHPDRPHRLTLKIKGGEPSALGVALVESNTRRRRGRSALGCCSTPAHRDRRSCGRATRELRMGGVPAFIRSRAGDGQPQSRKPRSARGPSRSPRSKRSGVPAPDRNLRSESGGVPDGAQTPWIASAGLRLDDSLRTAQNLVKYLGYCGATAVVIPEDVSRPGSPPKAHRAGRRGLTGPDRLEVIRRILGSAGFCALAGAAIRWSRAHCRGCRQADSAEALVRVGPPRQPGPSRWAALIIRCTRKSAKR